MKNNFRVSNHVYGGFDDKHGIKYPPKSEHSLFYIQGNSVTWCPGPVSISNADGLTGKTLISEYDSAEVKILLFGDSFSHWNQKNHTWPDLLETSLAIKLNKNVKVLNYARGTYGVLQMFDLAAEKITQHNPDFVIFAFISDDLTRNRWWSKTLEIDGYKRPLLSPSKTNFDLALASDEYLVNKDANSAWCNKSLLEKGNNKLLNKIKQQYEDIKKSTYEKRGIKAKTLLTINHYFLFNRIIHGHALPLQYKPIIPQVKYNNFNLDSLFKYNVRLINNTNIPYILYHLPQQTTSGKMETHLTEIQKSLLNSLHEATGKQSIKTIDPQNYDIMNLLPHDSHPNLAGLKYYANTMEQYLIKSVFFNKLTR